MSKPTKKPGRVKAALLEWLGVPVGLADEAFWANFGANTAGQQVNERSVLQLSAVWACARIIAETISTLPLGLYEKTGEGRRGAAQHPLYTLIHSRPNADTTAAVFWESMIVAMLLRGNGCAEMKFIGSRFVALAFLVPGRLSIGKDSKGKRRFKYTEKDGTQR